MFCACRNHDGASSLHFVSSISSARYVLRTMGLRVIYSHGFCRARVLRQSWSFTLRIWKLLGICFEIDVFLLLSKMCPLPPTFLYRTSSFDFEIFGQLFLIGFRRVKSDAVRGRIRRRRFFVVVVVAVRSHPVYCCVLLVVLAADECHGTIGAGEDALRCKLVRPAPPVRRRRRPPSPAVPMRVVEVASPLRSMCNQSGRSSFFCCSDGANCTSFFFSLGSSSSLSQCDSIMEGGRQTRPNLTSHVNAGPRKPPDSSI